MFHHFKRGRTTLAIYPNGYGFGYTVFHNPDTLSAWGVKRASGDKNTVCVRKFIQLLTMVKPADIILEDIPKKQEKRRARVADLIVTMAQMAMAQGCEVHYYSRDRIKEAFETRHAFTKHEIATAIGSMLPKLRSQVPPKRKPWEGEPLALTYFCAASLALTHFHFDKQ